jgi:hypothetical protein
VIESADDRKVVVGKLNDHNVRRTGMSMSDLRALFVLVMVVTPT